MISTIREAGPSRSMPKIGADTIGDGGFAGVPTDYPT